MKFDLVRKSTYSTGTEWIFLSPEQKINLHPLFKSIEDFDSTIYYNPILKAFYCEYGNAKGILSKSVQNIVDEILEYYTCQN